MAEDDDNEDGAADGEERSGGGSKKKLFIIIGAAVGVLIAAGAGIYFTGLLDSLLGHKSEVAETAEAPAGAPETKDTKSGGEAKGGGIAAPAGPVAFFDVPEMIVTLNTSPRSKAAFMKLHIMLEVASATDVPRVQLALPRIVDNLQPYLRELRVEELKGSPGAYRLKEEMLTRVRAAVAPTKINAVLLKDMQIQ